MRREPIERRLHHFFESLEDPPQRCWVAVSGGADSIALCHLLETVAGSFAWPLGIVHVHHGLLAEADGWEAGVRALAVSKGWPFQGFRVDARPSPGQSPEAAAREARYRAWRDWLGAGEAIVTAHHADDQAETLLLQLLRGAGPHGLAAMPAVHRLGKGWLLRPLLETGREELRQWARAHGLAWCDDPANRDLRHDRNYLRHRILPLLQSRWPGLAKTLHRAASLQGEAAALLDALGCEDLAACRAGETLRIEALQRLPVSRQRNLLRHWIRQAGHLVPPRAVLERIRVELPSARPDAQPCVRWPGSEVRRHRGRLYLLRPLPGTPPKAVENWDLRPLAFPALGRVLRLRPARGQGIAVQRLRSGHWEVRFRRGGERLRPAGAPHRRPLKHLLQEAGMPPWERRLLPLLWREGTLVAVPGLCVAEGWQAQPDGPGLVPEWVTIGDQDPDSSTPPASV